MITTPRSLKFNVALRTIFSTIDLVFSAITFPIVARLLNPEAVGLVDFANTTVIYFTTIGAFGVADYGSREFAKKRGDPAYLSELFSHLYSFRVLLCSGLFFLYVGIVAPIYGDGSPLFYLSSIAILFSIFNFSWIYEALEIFDQLVLPRLVTRALYLACILLFVKNEKDAWIYFLLMLTSEFVYTGYLTFKLRKSLNLRFLLGFKDLVKNALKVEFLGLFRIFSLSITQTILAGLPIMYLGKLDYFFEVGIFSTALRFFWLGFFFMVPLSNVLFMRSLAHSSSPDVELSNHLDRAFNAVVLLSISITVGLFLVSANLIHTLVGVGYERSIAALEILSALVVLQSMTNFWGMQVLFANGEDRFLVKSYVLGLFGCLIFLLSPLQITGELKAALSLVVAQVTVLLLLLWKAKKYYWPSRIGRDLLKVVTSSAAMFLIVRLVSIGGMKGLLLQIVLGLITFGFAITLLRHSLIEQVAYPVLRRIFKSLDLFSSK